jgi:hypothetical protein
MRKRRNKLLNNKYIIVCHIKINKEQRYFTYPLGCTPGVRVPPVEYHWSRTCGSLDVSQPYGPLRPVTGIALPVTNGNYAGAALNVTLELSTILTLKMCYWFTKIMNYSTQPKMYKSDQLSLE